MVERFVGTLLKEIGNLRASSSGIWSNLVFNVDEMKWKLSSAQLLTFVKYTFWEVNTRENFQFI